MRRVILFAVLVVGLSVCSSSVLQSAAAQAPVPAEYQHLYSLLQGTLDSYNAYLATLSSYRSYPVIFGAELLPANGNRGTQLLASTTMTFTEEGSSEENWMFFDEYEDREGYDKQLRQLREDPEVMKLFDEFYPKWDALIVPASRKREVWTEVEKLRVELRK